MNLSNLGLELTCMGETAAQRVVRPTHFHALQSVTSLGQHCLFVAVSKANPLKRSLSKQLCDAIGHF